MGSSLPFSGITSILKQPAATDPPTVPKIYTPLNWINGDQLQLYMIVIPGVPVSTTTSAVTSESSFTTDIAGSPNAVDPSFMRMNVAERRNPNTLYVFDALRRAQHRLQANPTEHPLQYGFNISDHIIMQPVIITLQVAMSDAVAEYPNTGSAARANDQMWGGNPSKSVSAFQTMERLMKQRIMFTLNTRLETYQNMVLTNIDVEDDRRTYFGGLSMSLTFRQLFIAQVTVQTLEDAARPQTTAQTTEGTKATTPPSQAVIDQHQIDPNNPPIVSAPGGIPTISGTALWNATKAAAAGLWSSTITSVQAAAGAH